jgi:hypothetical protein
MDLDLNKRRWLVRNTVTGEEYIEITAYEFTIEGDAIIFKERHRSLVVNTHSFPASRYMVSKLEMKDSELIAD